MRKKDVMILGAGYGGVFAAAHLCKENQYFNIHIIDKHPHLQLLQQIPYIILGSKTKQEITVGIHELFREEIDAGYLEFTQGVVENIDLDKRKITILHNSDNIDEEYEYDYLIISLGSETQYFNIQGSKEHSLPFRSVQDASNILERINSLSNNSIIVIGGGGPTGVSLAAALSESAHVQDARFQIKIIDSSKTLLPGWDSRLAKTSEKFLSSRRVEILTERRITRMTARSVITDLNEEIASDCTIWTAGAKGKFVKISPEIQRTSSETIHVDSYYRIFGFDNAFAIGDICEFSPDKEDNEFYSDKITPPKLAQLAVRQGRFVAENIVRNEKGQEMNAKFEYYHRGHTISLGNKRLAVLSGLLVTGDMCNYTEDTIVDNFVTEIKNREKGISAKALAATREDVNALEYPAAFNFVTYATSDAFRDLVR
jgi:NADH:ubiquinone reductase (H+-translocating)